MLLLPFYLVFWLDARNADLNDIIRQNQTVIASYEDFETDFRQIQQRIRIFSELTNNATLSSFVTKSVNLLPEDVKLLAVSHVDDSLQIKAASASERSIVQYITNLLNDPAFREVKVTNAVTSSENQSIIVFTLETKLSEDKGN